VNEPVAILLVEDEEAVRFALSEALAKQGYVVHPVTTAEEALARLDREPFDIVITDVKLPGLSGLEFVSRAKARHPGLVLIVMSGVASTREAMEALDRGAYDFFAKPFRLAELDVVMRRALEKRALQREVQELRARLEQRHALSGLIGQSGRMQEVLALLAKVIPSHATVLLQGESGTGKERVAEVIHRNGPRRDGPLVKVNCAAIPEGLLESELFGYERGAFTGADKRKQGYLEAADGGTLFLDEIGELAPPLQAKLLRVLESRRFMRVGGTQEISADVRIVAATNRDLESESKTGRFREDLYFRLSAFVIAVPPLRERPGEVLLLAELFARQLSQKMGTAAPLLAPDAVAVLARHRWPGNVRELRNAIERALVLAEGGALKAEHLPESVRKNEGPAPKGAMREQLADLELKAIEDAMAAEKGNQTRAAKRLGISRRALIYKLEKYGLKS